MNKTLPPYEAIAAIKTFGRDVAALHNAAAPAIEQSSRNLMKSIDRAYPSSPRRRVGGVHVKYECDDRLRAKRRARE